MLWAWLTGTPVQLFYFIAAVLGIPASLAFIVQLVHRALSRHAEKPAVQPAPPVYVAPHAGVSRNTGGVFSTGRAVDGFVPFETINGTRLPRPLASPSWTPPGAAVGVLDDNQWARYSWSTSLPYSGDLPDRHLVHLGRFRFLTRFSHRRKPAGPLGLSASLRSTAACPGWPPGEPPGCIPASRPRGCLPRPGCPR